VDIRQVLVEALKLLKTKPKVFVPRLVTTLMYSLFTLYSIGLTADFMVMRDPQMVAVFLQKVVFLFMALPPLYFVDILSYAMYPRIVEDHQSGRPVNLTKALEDGLRAWRVVVALGLTVFVFLILVLISSGSLQYLAFLTGNIVFTIMSALLALILTLFFAVIVFFVVPAAVLDNKGVGDSFRESLKLGLKHKGALLKLNLIFALLVFATMSLVFIADVTDSAPLVSISLFIVVRLLQAVVYTYVSVTNPLMYLQVRVNKSGEE
jgi:hypothetical protein